MSQPESLAQTCASSAESTKHPYYIVAAGYRHADPGNRLMHRLCSWLNLAGHESWIVTTDAHPLLWTPKLQDEIRAQHHANEKCPIVVFSDEKLRHSVDLGTKVHYRFSPFITSSESADEGGLTVFSTACKHGEQELRLPFLNLSRTAADQSSGSRSGTLVFADGFLTAGGAVTDLPPGAERLTASDLLDEDVLAQRLRKAATLYLFEPSVLSAVARACGCAVVHIRPTNQWPESVDGTYLGTHGLTECSHWQSSPRSPNWKVEDFLADYSARMRGWENDLQRFVDTTQRIAAKTPLESAWPQEVVLLLPPMSQDMQTLASRADQIKQLRINKQLAQWAERSTLREIDGEIYGNYVASGKLPEIAAVVYDDGDSDALADTLDSLSGSLLQPSELTIISSHPSPFGEEGADWLRWVQLPSDWQSSAELPLHIAGPLAHIQAPWVLAVRAGAKLQPNCTLEFAITAQTTASTVVYADDDVMVQGVPKYPHFKPNTNVEWLRCTNYLGDAVLLAAEGWTRSNESHRYEGVYSFALRALENQGRQGLTHIDTLLVHGSGHLSDAQLASEHRQVNAHLARSGLPAKVLPGSQRGIRRIEYPATDQRVSMVVPCSTQTGYLSCLLQSLATYTSRYLLEVLVVSDHEFVDRVEQTLAGLTLNFPARVIAVANQPYSHARALNAGASEAIGNVLLFADDDTEVIHHNWLDGMCGLFEQTDVAAVAPRLVKPGTPDPVMCGGPVFLGIGGLCASYNGEAGNVLESGHYGRLQALQDVSAFSGNFFLLSAAHFQSLGGFDEENFPLVLPVLDLALRANAMGLRHVWTPEISILHQGGKTLEDIRRLPENSLKLHTYDLEERRRMVARWAGALGTDPNYNRNLSLVQPFDLEQDIVIDWQPQRKDRPRVVAMPLSSGSGQYRVIEPLNALQELGKAQSAVILPVNRDVSRIPTSIELARTGLDRLIVQNAISDLQLARIEEFRKSLPEMGIIHMLDDLLGNLPTKHHLHEYHKREGSSRIRRSLEMSDRLVVTTETLKNYYESFVSDVRVIPNALVEKNWFDLPVKRRERKGKLRVGWAGAQQHLGDLDMIQNVVKHFSSNVEWIFMGMCPPSIQPHVKEVHSFVSINVYPQTLANLDLDIAIAPLEDNHFNACKSNLRLLEYGAMGWPVVCSDVFPYRVDNPPVTRVANNTSDWISAIDALIVSASLRKSMGAKLTHWVKDRYSLNVHADTWFKAIFDPINR